MMPNTDWTLLCSTKLNICYADLKTGRPAAHGLKRNVLWMIHEYNLPTMMLIKWIDQDGHCRWILKLWGSEATPCATLSFKGSYKISHSPWLYVSSDVLHSFAVSSKLAKKGCRIRHFRPSWLYWIWPPPWLIDQCPALYQHSAEKCPIF